MILSDQDIRRFIDAGKIRLSVPIREGDIRPTGIRLHLADELLIPQSQREPIDLGGDRQPAFAKAKIGPDGFILERGHFVLGASVEHISVDSNLVCQIDGRSTLARLGLMAHLCSTTFDHIQRGSRSVTFELANIGTFDLKLRSGVAVALLSFVKLSSSIVQDAHMQYDQQSGPTPPRLGYDGSRERGGGRTSD